MEKNAGLAPCSTLGSVIVPLYKGLQGVFWCTICGSTICGIPERKVSSYRQVIMKEEIEKEVGRYVHSFSGCGQSD